MKAKLYLKKKTVTAIFLLKEKNLNKHQNTL